MPMEVKLQTRNMWEAVRYGDADFYEDRRALEALLAALTTEVAATLVDKETAKDAWDAIATARIGSGTAMTTSLRREPSRSSSASSPGSTSNLPRRSSCFWTSTS